MMGLLPVKALLANSL